MTTGDAGSLAGVIYSIKQDQNSCIEDINLSVTISCICRNNYPCLAPYTWLSFPSCKCAYSINDYLIYTPPGTVILLSNATTTNIINSSGKYASTQNNYLSMITFDYLNNGAQWIWSGTNYYWPNGMSLTF